MFFKKQKLYKENKEKDYHLVKKDFIAYQEAKDEFKEITICNSKIFIINAENEDEFIEKYNQFMAEISEGIKQGSSFNAHTTLGAIFIKNKDKIEFKENNFIVKIEYKEIELKKKYTMQDYLTLKSSLEKLKKTFEEAECSFNRKYNKPFYSIYMDEVNWIYHLNKNNAKL